MYIKKNIKLFLIFLLFFSFSCTRKVDNLYREGYRLCKNKKYEDAILKYLEIANKYPKSKLAAHAQFQIGNIFYLNLRRFEEAVIEYQKLISKYPESELAYQAQFNIATIYDKYFNAKKDAIIEYYNLFKYQQNEEQTEQIIILISDCYLKINKISKAIETIEGYINIMPDSILSRFKLATLYDTTNDTQGTIKQYQEIINRADNKEFKNQARFWLAMIYEENKNYEDALKLYNILIEQDYNTNIIHQKIKELEKQ
jgi:TolA-binding protein